MKKRWLLRLGLIAGVAVLGLLVIACTTPNPKFELHRIMPGMTFEEVKRILGGPPGDYGYGESWTNQSLKRIHDKRFVTREWLGQEQKTTVFFDENDRVNRAESEWLGRRMSFTDLLRRVFHIR